MPTAPKMRLTHLLSDRKQKPPTIARWVLRYYFPEQAQQLNPCVQDGLMTMWCCKLTSYYRTARVGDLMIVFASANKKKNQVTGRVMFVCQWTGIVDVATYLNDDQHKGRFDCMYDTSTTPWTRNDNGGPWHRGDKNDTRRGKNKDGVNDYEYDQTRARVLMSTNFRDYHNNPRPMPPHLQHLVHKGIGCSKKNTVADECAVRAYFGL
jgi:hypothetical protein